MRWLLLVALSPQLAHGEIITFIESANPPLYFTNIFDGGCGDFNGNPGLCTNLSFIGWGRTNLINVESNQIVEIACNTFDFLIIIKNGIQVATFPGLNHLANPNYSLPLLPKTYPILLSGPFEMSPYGNGLLTYKLTPKDEPIQPGTGVVIPTDATGPVEIILESSADLVNWAASVPGIYGANITNRFFRVRAIRH